MATLKLTQWAWTLGCLIVLVTASNYAAIAAPAPTNELSVSIHWNPEKADPEGPLWLGYLLARAKFVGDHRDLYAQKVGEVAPTFGEEVEARTSAVQIYRELKEKDRKLSVVYFKDLDRVESNSFMREYVWTYLRQPTWGPPPNELKLSAFDTWKATNLANHQAITKGSIGFSPVKAKTAQSDAPSPEYTRVVQGRTVLQQGDPQRAITDYFDPVIEHFVAAYKGSQSRIYSAQNQVQMIMYTALPADKKQSIEVLDTVWADAYLLKAYALTELKRIPEAQQALESAIRLSPMNSQYLSELAYTYQVQKDCAKSIATYEQAASMAELSSEDATKTDDLTRAWRGQGYCLVEQGKLKEADAKYQQALALDPKDNKSKGELEYIRGLNRH
jgi:hypothetical protein